MRNSDHSTSYTSANESNGNSTTLGRNIFVPILVLPRPGEWGGDRKVIPKSAGQSSVYFGFGM